MTAGTRDYPEILSTDRTAEALERIATALEQLVLQNIPSEHAAFNAAHPAPQATVTLGDLPPWESAPIGIPAPVAGVYQAPVQAQPFPPMAIWQCPVHHASKIVPAGVSKSSGKPYNAFMSCTERDCRHVADRCRVVGCPDGPR